MFYILTRLNYNLLNLAVVLIYPFYSMIYKIKIIKKMLHLDYTITRSIRLRKVNNIFIYHYFIIMAPKFII